MEIQPGVKISCNGREGTLGLLVTPAQEAEKIFLMACWHTLDDGNEQGEVLLPEHDDLVIANYRRSDTTAVAGMDVAIAELTPDHGLKVSNRLLNSAVEFTRAAYWHEGITLSKYGAATGKTRCKLLQAYDTLGDLKHGLLLGKHPAGVKKYAAAGDSGAVWYNPATGKAIGLHAKGGLGENQAAAIPVILALSKLGLVVL